jgi:hypothetical protein
MRDWSFNVGSLFPRLHLNVRRLGTVHVVSVPAKYCNDLFGNLSIKYPHPIPNIDDIANAENICSVLKQLFENNQYASPNISMQKKTMALMI